VQSSADHAFKVVFYLLTDAMASRDHVLGFFSKVAAFVFRFAAKKNSE